MRFGLIAYGYGLISNLLYLATVLLNLPNVIIFLSSVFDKVEILLCLLELLFAYLLNLNCVSVLSSLSL